jgi:hypothetical protein
MLTIYLISNAAAARFEPPKVATNGSNWQIPRFRVLCAGLQPSELASFAFCLSVVGLGGFEPPT